MTTYAKYTIAMTFRICFTFGLLTVIYNWWVAAAVAKLSEAAGACQLRLALVGAP